MKYYAAVFENPDGSIVKKYLMGIDIDSAMELAKQIEKNENITLIKIEEDY